MSNGNDWITSRITEARKAHPFVTQCVADRMEALLNAQLSDRHLSKTELTSVAQELIAGMVPVPPQAEAKQ